MVGTLVRIVSSRTLFARGFAFCSFSELTRLWTLLVLKQGQTTDGQTRRTKTRTTASQTWIMFARTRYSDTSLWRALHSLPQWFLNINQVYVMFSTTMVHGLFLTHGAPGQLDDNRPGYKDLNKRGRMVFRLALTRSKLWTQVPSFLPDSTLVLLALNIMNSELLANGQTGRTKANQAKDKGQTSNGSRSINVFSLYARTLGTRSTLRRA